MVLNQDIRILKFLVKSKDANAKSLLDIIEISYRRKDDMLWKDLEKV